MPMRLNALDFVNFFLADVRGGLGPYLNVFLLTAAQWSPAAIGAVLSISGIIGIAAHPAAGAFIDRTHAKRGLIVAGAFLLSACGLAIVWAPAVPVVLVADVTMAVLGGVFAPAVAAITLGLYEREALPSRLGRNAAFDRAGNVFIAALAAALGVAYSQVAPFYLMPVFAALTTAAILAIPARKIDHEKARGFIRSEHADRPAGWRALIGNRPLVVFAAVAALFHFANEPMLALIVQRLALANRGWETTLTSAAIIIAQLATILTALLVTRANELGRKPLLLLAFAAVPVRGWLSSWSNDASWLLTLQMLDGVGGGLFDALLPLVLADIMAGTGRYNLARGMLGTVQGIGGSLSHFAAGYIATTNGYAAAFLTLSAVAMAGLLLILVAMPETTPPPTRRTSHAALPD